MTPRKVVGFVLGVAAFVLLATLDTSLQHFGRHGSKPALAAAGAALMAVWWITEALPIWWTACVPLVLFPFTGVFDGGAPHGLRESAAQYVHPTIWLFGGGMCIAAAMQQWGLDRRIALNILRTIGAEPRRLLLGFLAATAFVSLWISNTACATMMVPIGIAVIAQLEGRAGGGRLVHYGAAVMLSIAYGANIGGIGTKIGTPPNAQLAGFLAQRGVEVSFLEFAAVGLPFVVMFLPVAWLVLWRAGRADAPRGGTAREAVAEELRRLGPPSRGEWFVLAVFLATAALWIAGQPLTDALRPHVAFVKRWGTSGVEGATAALAALVLLAGRASGRQALEVRSLRKVSWAALVLLGGSFALAYSVQQGGLSDWFGERLALMRDRPAFEQLLVVSFATVGLSAFASNTATVAVMLPVLASAVTPAQFTTVVFVSAIAASCDFALPAGTPPNAIVFGSGYVTIPRMVRTGVLLDAVAALLVAAWCWLIVPVVFG